MVCMLIRELAHLSDLLDEGSGALEVSFKHRDGETEVKRRRGPIQLRKRLLRFRRRSAK